MDGFLWFDHDHAPERSAPILNAPRAAVVASGAILTGWVPIPLLSGAPPIALRFPPDVSSGAISGCVR